MDEIVFIGYWRYHKSNLLFFRDESILCWLKGVNSVSLDTARDIGGDGARTLAARDAYGFQLNYFAGDYRPYDTPHI